MLIVMQRTVLLLLLAVCIPVSAQVYQRVGPNGEVYFSDQPGPDAIAVEVEPAQSIKLAPVPDRTETGQSEEETQEAFPGYTAFSVTSPRADEGVRANDGNVTVEMSLKPGLQATHRIQLKTSGEDGEAVMTGDQAFVQLSNLSRGRHTVEASVIDDKGNTLIKAAPVSFNVLRFAGG
jgi:hypothetical protein